MLRCLRPTARRPAALPGPALLALALLGLLACSEPAPRPPTEAPPILRRFAACTFADGLAPVQVDRWPERNPRYRHVTTDDGRQEVSVLDGYRILYAYPGTDPFVNVKVELSRPERFARDEATVQAQLRHLAAQSAAVEVNRRSVSGIPVYGVDNEKLGEDALRTQRTLGYYVFFLPGEHLIGSVYLLNQHAGRRQFQTIAAYRELRERFLARFLACGEAGG